jgi:hypothetical protein
VISLKKVPPGDTIECARLLPRRCRRISSALCGPPYTTEALGIGPPRIEGGGMCPVHDASTALRRSAETRACAVLSFYASIRL